MTNPNDPAFEPLIWKQMPLTKREYFAAMAMQGNHANVITSNDELWGGRQKRFAVIAQACVEMADTLIAELNKGDK